MSGGQRDIEIAGVDPRTGKTASFRLFRETVDYFYRYRTRSKIHDLWAVKVVLSRPAAAFRGLRRVDDAFGSPLRYPELPDEGGLCLTGIPPYRVLDEGRRVKPPEGMTFAVYADRRLTIFDWEWRHADAAQPGWPKGWATDFEERVWPKS